jgi:hypothetical protein
MQFDEASTLPKASQEEKWYEKTRKFFIIEPTSKKMTMQSASACEG